MQINLLAVGKKMPAWVDAGVQEYEKRLPRELRFSVNDVALPKRGKNADIPRLIQQESDSLLKSISSGDIVVALDVQGKLLSTEMLSATLNEWMLSGDTVHILVGGPDGLSQQCLQRANVTWSLGRLTLPHPLVRVVLVEQLYRAWSMLKGHPYHR